MSDHLVKAANLGMQAQSQLKEAAELVGDYKKWCELLAFALDDWAYQYPDANLKLEYADALKLAEAITSEKSWPGRELGAK